ncbi:ROK family protein [Sphingobacterium shayense]|uniref:ROK family protein n=1 Tax=Sphingobacterium shayense TaxID=626343 RepID=UPI00155392AA|nr:ROK family protein [Sphingobacterium shayense]NQD69776.1 ROK family protein [Sphingobacterium shayense]
MSKQNITLCIDLGGTHCSSILINRREERVVEGSYFRGDVNSNASRQEILSQIEHVIHKTLSKYKISPSEMIVSCPGPFDYQNGISLMDGMNKYQDLLNYNLKDHFSDILGINSGYIHFYNDATAFLLGEIYCRKIQRQCVVGLTLGTGLGSSIYENGKVRDLNYGSASFAGGIAEDFISTRGMLAHLQGLFGEVSVDNIKKLVDEESLARERKEVFDFLSRNLSLFIKRYIVPLSPDLIVIGGSIAKAHMYFYKSLNIPQGQNIEIASFDERNLFLGLTFIPEHP